MSDELDELASAASRASNRYAPRAAAATPRRSPPARATPSESSPLAWGFGAAIGAAFPLFLTIVLAMLTAQWIREQIVRQEIDDAINRIRRLHTP